MELYELQTEAAETGTGSGRKRTHDFLSLCNHSIAQQDPRSPSQESGARLGQWTLTEQTSQALSDNLGDSNSLCSSQATRQKNKSYVEMMVTAKNCSQDEELDNEEALILNRESSNTQSAEVRVKVEERDTYQKSNTPRSKHSATEQRRRSKINDRFQKLEELIPRSEQKRDKASFLLEVIEYIQLLQEKVHKYEESLQGWNHDVERLITLRKNHGSAENCESRGTNSGSGLSPTLLFASKIDDKNNTVSPTIHGCGQNEESGLRTPITTTLQPNIFTPTQIDGPGAVSQLTQRLTSDAENTMYQPSEKCQSYTCSTEVAAASDKLTEKDHNIEDGAVSISNVYSKGLMDTLTQALQSSGVDTSQTKLSVQIELGELASIGPTTPMCGIKDDEVPSSNQGMMRSRVPSSEKSDQAVKRLKTCRS